MASGWAYQLAWVSQMALSSVKGRSLGRRRGGCVDAELRSRWSRCLAAYRDGQRHTDIDADAYRDANGDSHGHRDGHRFADIDADAYRDANGDGHGHRNAYRFTNADANAD